MSRVQDAEIAVHCQRGHTATPVLRFVRYVDGPPEPGTAFIVREPSWAIRAVKRPSMDTVTEGEQMQGSPNRNKLRACCPRCGLDVQRKRQAFGEVLDRLVDGGVAHIDLEHLARIVT